MAKREFLIIVFLLAVITFLPSCGFDVVEPPSLTLDDPVPCDPFGSHPSDWESPPGDPPGSKPGDWECKPSEPSPGWCPYGESVAKPKKTGGALQPLPEPVTSEESVSEKPKKSGGSLYDPWLAEENDPRDLIPKISKPEPEAQECDDDPSCPSSWH